MFCAVSLPVEIVPNIPYETLAAGNSFSKGGSVTRFCHQHSSNFEKVVGEQVWASPFKGTLLSVFIDQQLPVWGLDESECVIYFPLDDSIYSIEVGSFGACVPGSETIIGYDQTLEPLSLPLHILSGGDLTEKFDNVIELGGREKLKDFDFSSINKELLRNRYFVVKHYAVATLAVVLATVIISTVASRLLDSESPGIMEVFQEITQPTGHDLAVNQLQFIDDVLQHDINYFVGIGLHTFSYNTQDGMEGI